MTPQEISDHPSPEEFIPQWIMEGKPLQSIIDRLNALEYPERKLNRIVDSIVTTAIILKEDPQAGVGIKREAKKKIWGGLCIALSSVFVAGFLFLIALFSGLFVYGIPLALFIFGMTMTVTGVSKIKEVNNAHILAERCSTERLESYISPLEPAGAGQPDNPPVKL